MKFFYLTLFIPFLTLANSRITIQQSCDNKSLPLLMAEGEFIQERINKLPDDIVSFEALRKYLITKYPNTIEQTELLNLFDNLILAIREGKVVETRKVDTNDLLIDLTSECSYQSIFEEYNNGNFLISPKFYQLSFSDKLVHILEKIHLSLPSRYSDVGLRNYIYTLIGEDFLEYSDKELVKLKALAGFSYIYKNNTQIDIDKINSYRAEDDQIQIAWPIEDSLINTPGGQCIASTIRPVLFDEKGILKVFTVKNQCKLKIGKKIYTTRKESVVQLRDYGLFINQPVPLFIESIYVPTNTIIKTPYVDLRASLDPTKKSKLQFHLDGSGKIEGYVQFLGKVNYQGKFYKMKDYHNLWTSYKDGPMTTMVLEEPITLNQAGFDNQYLGWIQFTDYKTISRGIIASQSPYLLIGNTKVKVERYSEVSFYSFNDKGLVRDLTLGEDRSFKTKAGETIFFSKGQKVIFDPEGFVQQ